ncbi:prepilin-type N-terminal cleavage/methylation domain-containing protein [Acidovorax sp. MR-S7]|uniref:type IV pilus modification PilV family protein n=1 Tax=Acidovorax sp. MR-S7 TaxID=1268622 RepID=UPI00036938AA|nr:prepilin-type N-terminal cleavage/methylation domain-containing protein [Acidovorax sp. MR-S7]GAD20288.1 hypothetical protein AVS7_00049 [Acidovorax sp. MR-S7]
MSMKQRSRRAGFLVCAGGFSLLEALVAMAIASIAFAALYRTVGQGSKNVVDVQSRVQAALVVRSVLASAIFAEDLVRQPAGQLGAWQWNIRVEPEQIAVSEDFGQPESPPLRVARVTVSVAQEGKSVLVWTARKPYGAMQ